jgi:hypothetical protein
MGRQEILNCTVTSISTKKNTGALLNASEEIGLEVNAEETKQLHVHVLSPDHWTNSLYKSG